MQIIFISNYFNHHQKPVSDALYKLTDGEYSFIEYEPMESFREELGWEKYENVPYLVRYWGLSDSDKIQMKDEILDADIVITDGVKYDLTKERLKKGRIVVRYSERPLKVVPKHIHRLTGIFRTWRDWGRYDNAFLLASSAFSYSDFRSLLSFKDRAYKWGYFPEMRVYPEVRSLIAQKKKNSILWVARFLDWKHPEAPVYVAEKLRQNGVPFSMTLIGVGELRDEINSTIVQKDLSDCVKILGPMSPDDVRTQMEQSEVFLFTSDRNEGWGVVLNEAMNSACGVVAGSHIGSVPYLVINNKNGCVFNDLDWDDLYVKTKFLLDNPNVLTAFQQEAYKTILEEWNPDKSAKNLIRLFESILNGSLSFPDSGPCSVATK